MKKLLLLFITFLSFNTLKGMEEKALDNPQEPGTFDILPAETANIIMEKALENHLQEMNKLKSKKEFKHSFETFFRYLFSIRKVKSNAQQECVYILTPENIKKYIKLFAYQIFKLRKSNFIIPAFFLNKIKNAYPILEKFLIIKTLCGLLLLLKK